MMFSPVSIIWMSYLPQGCFGDTELQLLANTTATPPLLPSSFSLVSHLCHCLLKNATLEIYNYSIYRYIPSIYLDRPSCNKSPLVHLWLGQSWKAIESRALGVSSISRSWRVKSFSSISLFSLISCPVLLNYIRYLSSLFLNPRPSNALRSQLLSELYHCTAFAPCNIIPVRNSVVCQFISQFSPVSPLVNAQ